MAKTPQKGIPIGGHFRLSDEGKLERKPVPPRMSVSAKIQQRKSKKVRPSKRVKGSFNKP